MKICILFFLLFIAFFVKGQIRLDIDACRRMVFEQFNQTNFQGININVSRNQNYTEWNNSFKNEGIHGFNYIGKNIRKHSPIYWNELGNIRRNINYAGIESHSNNYLKNFPQTQNNYSDSGENTFLDVYKKDILEVLEQVTLSSQEIDLLRKQYSIYEKIVEVDIAYWELVYYTEMNLFIQRYRKHVHKEIKSLEAVNDKQNSTYQDIQKLQLKLSNIEKVWSDILSGKSLAAQNLCRILGFEMTTLIAVCDSLKSTFNPRITILESALSRRPEYNLYKKETHFQKAIGYLQDSLHLTFKDIFSFYRYDSKLQKPEIDEELIWKAYNIYLHKPDYYYKNGRLEVFFDENGIDSLNKQQIIKMISEEIQNATLNLEAAQKRVNITQDIRDKSQKNMETSALNWKSGNTVIDSYLENQTNWYYSWADWVNAKKELKIYETYYLRALGKLVIDI